MSGAKLLILAAIKIIRAVEKLRVFKSNVRNFDVITSLKISVYGISL